MSDEESVVFELSFELEGDGVRSLLCLMAETGLRLSVGVSLEESLCRGVTGVCGFE